jgi:hypothetical protein
VAQGAEAVSALYLYAFVLDPRAAAPVDLRGVAGESLRSIACGEGVFAAAGDMEAAPAIDAESLRRHDAAVRELAALTDAILPVRFGTLLGEKSPGPGAADDLLLAWVRPRSDALREALARVARCEQMTLRVFGSGAASPQPAPQPESDTASGPGARYLAARVREAARSSGPPELEPLREALAPWVRAERIDLAAAPPAREGEASLRASVYHLVERGKSAAYAAALAGAAAAAESKALRIVARGPFPPYAFTPEVMP